MKVRMAALVAATALLAACGGTAGAPTVMHSPTPVPTATPVPIATAADFIAIAKPLRAVLTNLPQLTGGSMASMEAELLTTASSTAAALTPFDAAIRARQWGANEKDMTLLANTGDALAAQYTALVAQMPGLIAAKNYAGLTALLTPLQSASSSFANGANQITGDFRILGDPTGVNNGAVPSLGTPTS